MLPGAVVLGDEGGKGVAEVLHGQVGKRVDLDGSGKGRHCDGAEAVDEALDEQDAEVHRRLLRAREERHIENFAEDCAVKPQLRPSRQQLAAAQARIEPEAEAGDVLREDRRGGGPGDAPAKDQHEEQIQPDVQQGGHAEEPERRDGIARRAQQTGKEIIERRGDQPREDDDKVFAHLAVQLRRNLQKAEDGIEKRIDRGVQHERHGDDQAERMGHRAAEPRFVLLPQRDGEQRTRAHREAEEDRRQKRHQRIGRADGGKRVFAERLADDQRVGDIIKLLQEVARDHRQGKQQQPLCDAAFGQVPIHDVFLPYFPARGRRPAWIVLTTLYDIVRQNANAPGAAAPGA